MTTGVASIEGAFQILLDQTILLRFLSLAFNLHMQRQISEVLENEFSTHEILSMMEKKVLGYKKIVSKKRFLKQ